MLFRSQSTTRWFLRSTILLYRGSVDLLFIKKSGQGEKKRFSAIDFAQQG